MRVMFSPCHTLALITYLIGDAAFVVHDTLIQPDIGIPRGDFPGGDARQLWDSIQAMLVLPDETRLFTGHDYAGRARTRVGTHGTRTARNQQAPCR